MADTHASMVDNPYHYSFKLCANALNNQNDSLYSNYLNVPIKDEFHCDQCDRSFKNSSQLKAHIKEHVVCNTNGCQFTAHPKIISAHIRMQHHSGIFNKIKKLDNPEEVQKWLADRKRKYPTQSNIAKQAKLVTEKRKRGELIEPSKERFNKNFKTRLGKRKRKPKNKKLPEENKLTTVEEIFSYEEKTKRNGSLPEFSGTGSIHEEVDELESSKKFYVSDEDETKMKQPKSSEDIHPMNKSLALLMASYNSGEESEDNNVVTSSDIPPKQISNPLGENDDGEPPEEIKNSFIPDTASAEFKLFPKHLNKGLKRYLKNNGTTTFSVRKRKPTLLQRLLEKQVVHERNVILDCIHYIVNNNFLQKADDESTSTSEQHLLSSIDISEHPPTISLKNINKVDGMKSNKKNFLLHGFLRDEIIREQNIVLQCIRFLKRKLLKAHRSLYFVVRE